ncbi:PREDICTED: DNA polymerase lambda-like isoform X1 [Amphimedon queenslandica]|uniref:DNA polymerase n=1 Tax=Amphimedon queenslandica TaxID=400682 RepID=A0AAN0IY88_AMPQE|nr:PREDICTED: DNA polymerase lambda-like isoform X1 [Amphimedon queenslandica]|eukprot:XP_019849408.1 PREDICTED: DNA polymerase lambda-like isoform X1 [Amphimedon queenslandica]
MAAQNLDAKAEANSLFGGIVGLIVEQGLGKGRKRILEKQLEEKGGTVALSPSQTLTHVIVGPNMKYNRLVSLLKLKDPLPPEVTIVTADWLSASLVAGESVDHTPYLLPLSEGTGCVSVKKVSEFSSSIPIPSPPPPVINSPNKHYVVGVSTPPTGLKPSPQKLTPTKSNMDHVSPLKVSPVGKRRLAEPDSDSDYIESEEEEEEEGEESTGRSKEMLNPEALAEQGLIRPLKKKGRWMCQVPASTLHAQVNHNEAVTSKLEELLLEYKNSSLPKDKWRAMSLTKAVAAVKRHPKEITTHEEAHSIPFVGKRLADKIYEIVSSGHLRRLDHIDKAKQSVIDLFKGIHGVGQIVAEQFYAQGYRTLDDLKEANILNRQQQIGFKYYHEFAERMDRSEVEEIERKVREGCHLLDPNLEVVTCGSFRRGKPTCGDVDILVTHPDGRSHKGIFQPLIRVLKNDGFLTDDLTLHEDTSDGSCKYFGVCMLPGDGRKHRRIDIYICPYSEYPLMLLHFTGSGHFNRSLRSRADKMGMSLSEHSLNAGVVRKNGVKVFEGTPLPVFTEADVFKYLGVDYLEPHDRDLD